MLRPWHCRSTSCHRKLSIGRHDRSCSRSAVITCKLNKLCHSVPFKWKVIFEDTVYSNRSGTPSWTMSLLMYKKKCGAFSSGERFFSLIVSGAIKAKITEPWQRSDLLQGGLEVLCIDSWAPSISLNFSFSQDHFVWSSRSNVASHSNLASYCAKFLGPIFYLCVIWEK